MDDFLKRKVVSASIHAICAKEVETTFIIIMREHVTTSVQGNLVARTRIHEQVHRGILVDVKVEVDEEVQGFLIFFSIIPFGIRLVLFLVLRV